MASIRVYTTSEDGYIEDNAGLVLFKSGSLLSLSSSSSQNQIKRESFTFHNTNDSSTGLPASATNISVTFNFFVVSSVGNEVCAFLFYACSECIGTTLELADWGNPNIQYFVYASQFSAGWNQVVLPVAYLNRAGYTNIRMECLSFDASLGGETIIHSFENASGNKPYLEITYTSEGSRMINKLKAERITSSSPSVYCGQVSKRTFDEWFLPLDYSDVLSDGDYISSCTVDAALVSTGADATSTMLNNTGGPPPNAQTLTGTATGGSTTTLIDTTKNFSTEGVRPGDRFLNSTKGFVATVKRIYKTTNPYDTLEFDTAVSASAASDAYKFLFAIAKLKGGTTGLIYEVRWKMTSNLGYKFQDKALINVLD